MGPRTQPHAAAEGDAGECAIWKKRTVTVLLVTFHFASASRRQPLLDALKHRQSWSQMAESVFLVATEETADQFYQSAAQLIGNEDSMYVITLSHPYRGFGQRHVNLWLDEKLPPLDEIPLQSPVGKTP
jgi:hypothetical protein